MPNIYRVGMKISLAGREGRIYDISPGYHKHSINWNDAHSNSLNLDDFPDVKILPDPVVFTEEKD